MPSIHALHEKLDDENLEFVLVNVMESPEVVKRVVADRGYELPVLLDVKGEAAREYRVWGTPGVYLVDPQGYVVALGIGRRNWDSEEGMAVLRALTH